jgi:hypothetical protein
MQEKVLVLISSIRQDLETIAEIFEALACHPLEVDADDDRLIVVGYRLHNLYNAFENVFEGIAAVFENSIDEAGRWHVQLLERMRLDTMPLRPAVIDDAAYDALDELRRFRHLFRHAYGTRLDAARMQLVARRAMVLEGLYQEQLGRFVGFLEGLVG